MKGKNLLIIMADQLRKDYLGCYGNPYVRTPNIDSIAQESLRFEQCFVNNTNCMPNRMSIFTGLYPRSHGMWTNGLHLAHPLPTLADHLGHYGYSTCSIGKVHFESIYCGPHTPMVSHEDHRLWEKIGDDIDWFGPYWGYQHVEFTSGHATRPLAHYGKWFRERGGTDDMAAAQPLGGFDLCPVTTMPERLHNSIFVGERSAAYIREHAAGEQPFMLVASFPDPRHPFNPPLETALRYKDAPVKPPVNENDDLATRPPHYLRHQQGVWHRAGLLKTLPGMSEEEKAQAARSARLISGFTDDRILRDLGILGFGGGPEEDNEPDRVPPRERDQRIRSSYAMIDLVDQGVGMILEALRETGALNDTVIVFTSDHGELMGDHGLWFEGPFFYDGLVSVPLLIRAPERGMGATRALASSVDIYPTCCDLLGLPTPRSAAGVSQLPAFGGWAARTECLIEYRNGYFENDAASMAYIDGRYKFVQYQDGSCELTDRAGDPDENVNLAFGGANRELVEQYRGKMLMMVLKTGSSFPDQISHA